jgi:hypothetical protein
VPRHDLDLSSLLMGLVLCALAGAVIVAEVAGRSFDPRWLLPSALLLLGTAGIAGSVGRRRSPVSGRHVEQPTSTDEPPNGGSPNR